ncbi:hypothetical protein COC42_07510 [Sphingomonas spermidinifaciens]|uniref:DUF4345 domain-containing protein n=1 Tax=Sphingomonas spermidinifaciens TaxID=1141889 RepID=A0A2A4B8N3_9SPHN|nr:DUF4345 domain-containing protein [Sphingomonas spermidinifaciens]PCD04138.1 hypothetical protein COC42_07510 [Sphingomonas spermidinifaciens]
MTAGRGALQAVVALASIVPLSVAAISLARGPVWMGQAAPVATDLDSHFRYLSGIFLALGLGFASCIPGIERKGPRLRLLGALVIAGGLGRAWSFIQVGAPSAGHLGGLGIELGLVPIVLAWQAVLARRTSSLPPRPRSGQA